MKSHDQDPSISGSNRSRNIIATGVGLVTAGILAATLTADIANHQPKPRETTTTLTPEDQARDQLLTHIDKTAQDLATEIMGRSKSSGKDSTGSMQKGQEQMRDGKIISYTYFKVETSTNSLVGGDYGQYLTEVKVLNDETGNPDLNTIDEVYISMDTRQKSESVSSYGHFYAFELIRPSGNYDDWRVVSRVPDKGLDEGSEAVAEFYSTEDFSDKSTALQPLTIERFDALLEQAVTIMGWGDSAAPVNYAPATS